MASPITTADEKNALCLGPTHRTLKRKSKCIIQIVSCGSVESKFIFVKNNVRYNYKLRFQIQYYRTNDCTKV